MIRINTAYRGLDKCIEIFNAVYEEDGLLERLCNCEKHDFSHISYDPALDVDNTNLLYDEIGIISTDSPKEICDIRIFRGTGSILFTNYHELIANVLTNVVHKFTHDLREPVSTTMKYRVGKMRIDTHQHRHRDHIFGERLVGCLPVIIE